MPYIITTKTPEPGVPAGPWGHNITRRAVATLSEARRAAYNAAEAGAVRAPASGAASPSGGGVEGCLTA